MNSVFRAPSQYVYNLLTKLFNFFFLNPTQFLKNSAEENRVRVLHRSDNFLVVDKPYDMVINSNNADLKYSLQTELRSMFPELANSSLRHEFHFVHRLDYATSGVICLALNKRAARAAAAAFEERRARKYYLAIVHGHLKETRIVVTKAIGDDAREKNGNHRMCTEDSSFCVRPRKSNTALLVLERGFRDGKPATKVLLCPGTGRRHQLRVHCAHVGHTIIGDYTYSERRDVQPYRTFLHSFRLILKNEVENLDVRTNDPLGVSNSSNRWRSTEVIRRLDDSAFTEIDELM